MKRTLIHFGVALLGAAMTITHAGTHVWTGAGGSSWNLDANWSSGGKPTVGEAPPVILVFPPAGAKLSTNNIPGLLIDQMQVTGTNYRFGTAAGAVFTFNTNAASAVSNAPFCNTVFNGDVALIGTTTIDGSSAFDSVTFMGAISGAGGLRILGGKTVIAGNPVNSFSGPTLVENGELQLSKSNGPAITGDLVVGITFGGNNNERVRYLRSHQVADASSVFVKGTGLIDLNGYSDTVDELTLSGGEIETGAGMLTLGNNVIVQAHTEVAIIDGRLNLGSTSKSFDVASNAWLDVLATVSGAVSASLNKGGLGIMTLSSSNSFSGPAIVNAGVLGVFDPQALGATNSGTTVQSGGVLQLLYTSLSTSEQLTLNGHGANGLGAFALTGPFDATVFGNIVLANPATISVDTNLTLVLKGRISGPGALHKTGAGELWMDGGPANTFGGGTFMKAGRLTLSKGANVIAIPGALVVGDNVGGFESDVVQLLDDGQIHNGAAVTVKSTGLLDLAQQTQAMGTLLMEGSAQLNVDNGGVLNMPSLITFDPTNAVSSGGLGFYTPAITGFGEAHLVVPTTIDSSWVNNIRLRITGAAGAHLIKAGEGSLGLLASNSYAGLTLVKRGVLSAANDFSLGSAAGATIVTNSGALSISYDVSVAEPLVLASDSQNELHCVLISSLSNTWTGTITLLSNSIVKCSTGFGNGKLRLAGAISGPGKLIKVGDDPLEIIGTAANTFSGGACVNEGALWLNKTNAIAIPSGLTIGDGTNSAAGDEVRLLRADQISDSSVVEVKLHGLFHLNSFNETVGSLQGAGTVSTLLGTLTAGGNNFTTTFSGWMGGIGVTSFIKQGSGHMLFTGTNTASGRTVLRGGRLIAHGAFTGAIHITNNGTLGGNGLVGNVFATNGVVSPGAGPGLIDTKNLTLDAASSLRVELNGTNAGVNCDLVNVTGALSLGGASLEATLGFASALSNQFMIINNDGADAVVGTFGGLPEGATTLIGGATFKISYIGGDGNDVVLTQISMPPQPTMGGVARLPNGHMQISGQGVPGTPYHLFANTDLNTTNWVFIGTANPSLVTGNMLFTDTNAPNFAMRFYRFVLP